MGGKRRKGFGKGSSSTSIPASTRQQMRFDRRWFEEHPEHQVLLRPPYSFEIADYESKTGELPCIVLVCELAEGARYRVFGSAADLIEVERYELGHRKIERKTVAEFLQGTTLPYGSHLEYTLHHRELMQRGRLA
jgi:hypothetical protein